MVDTGRSNWVQKIGLKKSWHPIKVEYFQQGLAKSLFVIWEDPGVKIRKFRQIFYFFEEIH